MPTNNDRSWTGIAVALGVLLVLIVLWRWSAPAEHPEPGGGTSSEAIEAEAAKPALPVPPQPAPPPTAPAPAEKPKPEKRRVGKPMTPEMERLRARVIDALDAPKPRTAETEGAAVDKQGQPKPGEIKDRTGELNPETLNVLNSELVPLMNECVEQAQERHPDMKGMLSLSVELAAAEEVGTIFEAVEPADNNEVKDDELFECVRQSAFTIRLPLPLKSGRTSKQITWRTGPADPAAPAE